MMSVERMKEVYKNIKFAFFDLDGTLSVPCYEVDGKFLCGMPKEKWFKYNIAGVDTYKECRPVKTESMWNLLDFLKSIGVDMKILTVEYNAFAYFNKIDFVLRHYGKYFSDRDVIFCTDESQKIDIMKTYSCCKGFFNKNILYVDDNFNLCISASNEVILTMHNSYFY